MSETKTTNGKVNGTGGVENGEVDHGDSDDEKEDEGGAAEGVAEGGSLYCLTWL